MEIASALYKYCPPERVTDLIENKTIRFSPVCDLNDPFEGLPNQDFLSHLNWLSAIERELIPHRIAALRLARARDGRIFKDEEVVSHATKQIRDELSGTASHPALRQAALKAQKNEREQLRILCFSQTPPDHPDDALLIWAHYTAGHKGFVVGFDPKHSWISDFDAMSQLTVGPIKYHSLRPSVQVGSDGQVIPDNNLLFHKSANWSYEREYRIIAPRDHKRFRHEKISALADIPAGIIQTITIGAECESKTMAAIVRACKQTDMRHVRLRSAEIDSDRYALILRDL